MNTTIKRNKNAKKISYITLILSMVIALHSCDLEKDLEIDGYAVYPRLVLNGLIFSNKDTNQIYFSESKSLFSKQNAREVLEYTNEYWSYKYPDPKVYLLPDVETTIFRNDVPLSNIYTNPEDSITYYVNRFDAGDRIRVEAAQNGRKVSATATIPAEPVILEVDTISFYDNGLKLRLLIKIKDQPGVKNYYRLFIDQYYETFIDPDYARVNNFPEVFDSYQHSFQTEDPVITNGYPENNNESDFDIITYEKNHYNIFNDEVFENDSYPLNVYIHHPNNDAGSPSYYNYSGGYIIVSNIIKQRIKINVRLQAINNELYQYFQSLQKFIYYDYDLIEPVRIFNNIEGGVGIWGTINEVIVPVFEKEFIDPTYKAKTGNR